MESRISYLNNLENAELGEAGIQSQVGSFFAIDTQVPSLLRGSASGFCVQTIVRSHAIDNGPAEPLPEEGFLFGSQNFVTGQNGWSFVQEEGESISINIGAQNSLVDLVCGFDVHLMMNYDPTVEVGTSNVFIWANGVPVDEFEILAGDANSVVGPANFSIGGFLDVENEDEVGGQGLVAIAGVWVGPGMVMQPAGGGPSGSFYTQSGASLMWEAAQDVLDLVDSAQAAVQVPSAPQVPTEAAHVFSVRRGLPNFDMGTTQWVDEVAGTVLTRRGTPRNYEIVDSRRPAWLSGEI